MIWMDTSKVYSFDIDWRLEQQSYYQKFFMQLSLIGDEARKLIDLLDVMSHCVVDLNFHTECLVPKGNIPTSFL